MFLDIPTFLLPVQTENQIDETTQYIEHNIDIFVRYRLVIGIGCFHDGVFVAADGCSG